MTRTRARTVARVQRELERKALGLFGGFSSPLFRSAIGWFFDPASGSPERWQARMRARAERIVLRESEPTPPCAAKEDKR